MQKTISAVYENGLLRPLEPLGLVDRQHVSLTIHESTVAVADDYDLLDQELLNSLATEELPEVVRQKNSWVVGGSGNLPSV